MPRSNVFLDPNMVLMAGIPCCPKARGGIPYTPRAGYVVTQCEDPACRQDIWVGPTQKAMLDQGVAHVICATCCLKAGIDVSQVKSLT